MFTEHKLRRAAERIAELEAEVLRLRRELEQLERARRHAEILFQNALLREWELRAEFRQGQFSYLKER